MMASHMSESGERYTPPWLVDFCRSVVGDFDLDPASSAKANSIIQAKKFFTREDESLKQDWTGTIFLNPPGSCQVGDSFPACGSMIKVGRKTKKRRTCSCSLVRKFWEKMVREFDNDPRPMVWIGFNPSQLQTLQTSLRSPLDFLTVFLDRRVKYLDSDLNELSSPPHPSYVTFLGVNPNTIGDEIPGKLVRPHNVWFS